MKNNKSSKKSSKPAPKETVQRGPAQAEPLPPAEPPAEPAQMQPVHTEPPPPQEPPLVEVVQKEPVHREEPPPVAPPPLVEPPVVEPPPPMVEPAPVMEPAPIPEPPASKRSPQKDKRKEKLNMQNEMARKEQVLIEVGLVPVKDSQLRKESAGAQDFLPPSPPLPKENLEEEESADQKSLTECEENKEAPLQKVEAEETDKSLAGLAAVVKESADISSSEQNLNMPEGETSDGKHQADTGLCEMDARENKTENPPEQDSAVEEPVSPLLLPLPTEKGEAVFKTGVASPPVTIAVNESQEMDEDEGIHSHDGSDLSDNMSEGSDDSGLNGARPVPQETSRKNAKEALPVKVADGDFVCIFCDRSFRKEKDYSKHLNRHLVNVYFLEKAAKGQE